MEGSQGGGKQCYLFTNQTNQVSLLRGDTNISELKILLDAQILKSLQDDPLESFVDTEDERYRENPIVLDRFIFKEDDRKQTYNEVDSNWRAQDANLQMIYD